LNSFQRKFTSEVRRCDEMERKLNYIEREVLKDEVNIPDVETADVPSAPNPREMVNLEAQLEKTENEIQELSENSTALYQNFVELNELKYVLEKTQTFFSAQEQATNLENVGGGGEETTDSKNLGFVAGVVAREKVIGFERMLWRISRGNVFLRQAEIETPFKDPKTVSLRCHLSRCYSHKY
jgi:V-type H+-transporting ATPase subunit a